jgi:hypothetical protein
MGLTGFIALVVVLYGLACLLVPLFVWSINSRFKQMRDMVQRMETNLYSLTQAANQASQKLQLRIDMLSKTLIIPTAVASLTMANTAQAAYAAVLDLPLTPEEQALVRKGDTIQAYQPTKHSSIQIVRITSAGPAHRNPTPAVCFTFGLEDAEPARTEGRNMAPANDTPQMTQQFLFAEGRDKYHDRFFTRAYVQQGLDACSKARRERE